MQTVNELVLIGLSINEQGEVEIQESRKSVVGENTDFFYIESENGHSEKLSRISKKHQYQGQDIDNLTSKDYFNTPPSFVDSESSLEPFKKFLFDLAVKRLNVQLNLFKEALKYDKTSFYDEVSAIIEDKIVEIFRDNEVVYLSFFYNQADDSFGFVANLVTYVEELEGETLQLFESHLPFRTTTNKFNEVMEDESMISCFILMNDFEDVKGSCLRLFAHMDIILMEKINILESHIESIYFKQVK